MSFIKVVLCYTPILLYFSSICNQHFPTTLNNYSLTFRIFNIPIKTLGQVYITCCLPISNYSERSDFKLISKATRNKLEKCWNNRCAICGGNDYLEVHHLIAKSAGGTDDYDNLILLCACCHAAVHNKAYNPDNYHQNTSINYESAKPILAKYFANEIGARETKEKLHLSQKTHLSESSVFKRYKREHNIEKFYNNVDLVNSMRRKNV